MTFEAILKEMKQGKYHPLYFLYGEEAFFIDHLADYVETHALAEAEKAFNQTVLYGKEADPLAVVDVARRYPMMASRQVVILKEAQEMRDLGKLQPYVEKPLASTVLVICHKYKKFNLNTKFGKLLKKQAVVFQAKKLYDNQVPDWIKSYLQSRKLDITPGAAGLIAEYLGADLSKVANELDKLALNLAGGARIDESHIEEHIGISKDYNIFELQRALSQRDLLKSTRIAQYFAANPKKNPFPVVIGSLYNYFSKIYMLHFLKNLPEKELLEALGLRSGFFLREYRQAARTFNRDKTEEIIELLKAYDLKSKGVDYVLHQKPEEELMGEMVYRILH